VISITHCDKSLFVLASHQKIPVLRTENPAVDTRTICLPPIEFFKIPLARKATDRKSRPKTTDTARKSRPSGPCRKTFYIPMPEGWRFAPILCSSLFPKHCRKILMALKTTQKFEAQMA
jgi:hypothetical protein